MNKKITYLDFLVVKSTIEDLAVQLKSHDVSLILIDILVEIDDILVDIHNLLLED